MTRYTVTTPLPPCPGLWFENLQLSPRWLYGVGGPRYPRGGH